MLVDFFFLLRTRGINVSLTELLLLIEALQKGHADSNLVVFYALARSILVKKIEHFDIYDRVFAEFFKDVEFPEAMLDQIHDELLDWLKNPKNFDGLLPDKDLKAHDLETLRKMFEERLKEQKERHDGGSKWIGTGGTSPFGHGGSNPAGVRIGGPGGGRSAVQIAMDRRFHNLRSDLVLDVRQFSSALRRLRILSNDGQIEELDIEKTIDKTAQNAGDIEFVFSKARKNQVKLLLLCDVGGSMNPYTRTTSLLFSAAHQAQHFKQFKSYYFHNCVYGKLYSDMHQRESVDTKELLKNVDSTWRCIIVGDAAMAPYELSDAGGALDFFSHNRDTGLIWLQRILEKIPRSVWLNPDPVRYWNSSYTARIISELYPMFPFTLSGIDDAIAELRKR